MNPTDPIILIAQIFGGRLASRQKWVFAFRGKNFSKHALDFKRFLEGCTSYRIKDVGYQADRKGRWISIDISKPRILTAADTTR